MIEKEYVDAEAYFTKETARNYDRSSRMREVQREIALRALNFLEIRKGNILDIGCGTGFSMEVFVERGFDVTGVDIAEPMVAIAKRKGLNVIKGDFASLPFDDASFDGIVSLSALQWVYGKSYDDVITRYKNITQEFYRVLKPGKRGVVYFHPKTGGETNVVFNIFKHAGFLVRRVIDYPEVTKKRKEYILLRKEV